MTNALILLLLVGLLTACGPKIEYRETIVREGPSPYLLVPFVGVPTPVTYADYVSLYWADYVGLVQSCNIRLEAIKQEYPNGNPTK